MSTKLVIVIVKVTNIITFSMGDLPQYQESAQQKNLVQAKSNPSPSHHHGQGHTEVDLRLGSIVQFTVTLWVIYRKIYF